MSGKVYLHLFILCGISSHVIVMTSSEENIPKSSDLLLRKKRVLNYEPGADIPVRITDFPYVVHIKKSSRISCVGSILSPHTVITAAECVDLNLEFYKIYSGIIRTSGGKVHKLIGKKTHFGSNLPRNRVRDGIALVTVYPIFVYNQYTHNIKLHQALLLPNTLGTVAGWGYLVERERGTKHCEKLRAITVPIMDHRECVNIYRGFANITDEEICTFHTDKHCGHTDIGAGLVVNNELAGIHLWGGNLESINKPDVFLLVQHLEYSNWIRANIV